MIVASDPAQADRPARITVTSGAVGLFLPVSCYRGNGSSESTHGNELIVSNTI